MTSAAHPGTVTFVDLSRGTTREAAVADIPEAQRFVHLRDGVPVQDLTLATECVPVVHVEMMAVDQAGKLVAPEAATTVVIHEFGPERRLLRTTRVLRNAPAGPTAP